MLDFRHQVHDGVSFDYNGQQIRFGDWDDDAFGEFHYETKDGHYHFVFDVQPSPDGDDTVRIYIIDQPEYEGRDNDGESTHRLMEHGGEHAGHYYVCVERGSQPTTVPEALSWLVYWCEKTGEYIATGRKFS